MTKSFPSGSNSVALFLLTKEGIRCSSPLLQEAILGHLPLFQGSNRHSVFRSLLTLIRIYIFVPKYILRVRSLSTKHEFLTMSSFSGSDSVVLSCCPERDPECRSSPPGTSPGPRSSVPKAGAVTVCYVPCLAHLASSLFTHIA